MDRVRPLFVPWFLVGLCVIAGASYVAWRMPSTQHDPPAEVLGPAQSGDVGAAIALTAAPSASSGARSVVDSADAGARVFRVHVVRDEDGSALGGAQVEVRHGGIDRNTPPIVVTKLTDQLGNASFDIGEAMQVRVRVEMDGRKPSVFSSSPERSDWGGDIPRDIYAFWMPAEITLNLVLTRSVSVRLVDGGGRPASVGDLGFTPQFGAKLNVVLTETCEPIGTTYKSFHLGRSTETDRVGMPDDSAAWRIDVDGRERVCVLAVLDTLVIGSAMLEHDALTLDLPVARGVVESVTAPFVVRVVTETDESPIEGAVVEYGSTRLRTDEDGVARFTPRFDGMEKALHAFATGHATVWNITRLARQSEVVVRLGLGRVVDGVVRNEIGEPVANVSVALYAIDPDDRTPWILVAKSLRNGTFRFTDLAATTQAIGVGGLGSFVVSTNPGALPSGFQIVDCSAGDVTGVELQRLTPSEPRPSSLGSGKRHSGH